MTEWRDHPRYGGYQASDDGQIRSVDRMVRNRWGNEHLRRGRVLATFIRKGGYLGANLSHEGQRINFEVHVMVAEAWHGVRPEGMQVRHIDGDQLNNRPGNLAWDTIAATNTHRVSKTHCSSGHEYSDANTYRAPSAPDKRQCRTCMKDREARRPPRTRRKVR